MKRALAVGALTMVTAGCSRVVEGQYRMAEQSRVKDAVSTYEQARSRGDTVAVCVAAGAVASAYTDAHDQSNQQAWNARRKEDCHSAYIALTPSATPPRAHALDGSR